MTATCDWLTIFNGGGVLHKQLCSVVAHGYLNSLSACDGCTREQMENFRLLLPLAVAVVDVEHEGGILRACECVHASFPRTRMNLRRCLT